MPASPLATLSSTLLTSVPEAASEHDVNWSAVSSVLKDMRLRSQEELKELTMALDSHVTNLNVDTVGEHDDVLALLNELKSLHSEIAGAEQHFRQLESVVRPGLCKLRTLQSRAKYLEMAVQVEKLSQEAKNQAVEASPNALKAFQDFGAFVATIPIEFSVIRKEAARRVEDLTKDLRHFGVQKLQLALETIGWPEPLSTQQELTKKEAELCDVSKAFAYLLTLQLSQQSQSASTTMELWAMDCVLEPLLLRFRYHFERAESATNRLTKPEWYLSHVHEQTNAHTRFLAHALTPELHRHREEIHCWDAQILLLCGLVKSASRKLKQDLLTLLAHPPLLCHTLDEILLFERSIDEDIGYDSWAGTDRHTYPRCIDVFTSNNDVLFAWTNTDVEYAHRVLSSIVDVESSSGELESDVSRGKQGSVWQLEADVYRRAEGSAQEHDTALVAPVALRFVALLDFLSQRFTFMETEEHRYLYVMQVHLPLLRRFGQLCEARGRQLLKTLTKKTLDATILSVWGELFVVVNALQHVVHTLAAWEQSSVFLELSRKIAQSETTRAQVLRMHLAYSKQVFARASAAVLATEEATAVRQALAGPGAMIGPSAAFSAVYSVGSKTMKSLFHRAETDGKVEGQSALDPLLDISSPAASTNDDHSRLDEEEEQDDPETLMLSHSIFERQITELKALATTLLDDAKDMVVSAVKHDVETYRSSPFWIEDTHDDGNDHLVNVSSELASCYTLVSNVLSCARKLLLHECLPAFWKPLAGALDAALFDVFCNPASTAEKTQLSSMGKRQFVKDVKYLAAVFAAGSSKALPRSYFRLTREVCHLVEMPAPRLREVYKALDDESVALTCESADTMEQLVTILEACGIYTLTPAQVAWICTTRLGYCS